MNNEIENFSGELKNLREKVAVYEQVLQDLHLYSAVMADHNAIEHLTDLVSNWVESKNNNIGLEESFDKLKLREYHNTLWNSGIKTKYNKLRL